MAEPYFAVRGDTTTAYKANGYAIPAKQLIGALGFISTTADAGAIGGSKIEIEGSSPYSAYMMYQGQSNLDFSNSGKFSIVMRFKFRSSPGNFGLFQRASPLITTSTITA